MWRAFFLAIGAMLIIVGIETLLIDSATVYSTLKPVPAETTDPNGPTATKTKVVKPEEWMPWSAMSIGAIVVLYAFTLPQRWSHGAG